MYICKLTSMSFSSICTYTNKHIRLWHYEALRWFDAGVRVWSFGVDLLALLLTAESVFKDVLQKSTSSQIRQLILYYYQYKE